MARRISFDRPVPLQAPRIPQAGRLRRIAAREGLELRPLAGPEIPMPPDQDTALADRAAAWMATYNGSLLEFIVWDWLVGVKKQRPGLDFCPTPGHKVLTADLRWVPVESLAPGDHVAGFSSQGPWRKWQDGIVLANAPRVAPVYRLLLEDGTELNVTGEHPWLTSYSSPLGFDAGQHWIKTRDLRPGIPLLRFVSVWEPEQSWDAGWLAGLFDGEGCLTKVSRTRACHNLLLAQKPGPVLDRALSLLAARGFQISEYYSPRAQQIRINGRMHEMLRLLGSIRPQRLLEKFNITMPGTLRKRDAVRVESVQSLGQQEICALSVSTETYFLDGFASHNTYQDPFMGGRTAFGGVVLDFYFPLQQMGWNVQGLRWHWTNPDDRARSMISKQLFASRGINLLLLWEDDLLVRPDLVLNAAWRGEQINTGREQ